MITHAALTVTLSLSLIAAAVAAEPLQVFAAASLAGPFQELGKLFGRAVTFQFAGTSELRMQIEHGARADVLAFASTDEMDRAVDAGLVREPRVFAKNRLVLIVPRSNPGRIRTFRDLARPALKLVTTHPGVPIGKYTLAMFERVAQDPDHGEPFRDAVKRNFVSLEINVKHVCAKVSLSEADGGIVYYSDVTARLGQTVRALDIPDRFNVQASYAIAVVARSSQPAASGAFLDLVVSPEGQAILARHNFGTVR
jgi:molybdate transport system substrate-binding protein